MKPVLYLGAMLMVGATIYGFADYKKTSHNREFKKMYEAPADEKTTDVVPASVPTSEVKTKEEIKAEPAKMEISVAKEEKAAPVVKYKKAKRKKLSYKEFSRAPLRE